MGKFDFIISMLNISEDMIQDLSISKKQDTLHIHTTLKSKHPRCPYCDGDTNIKGYSSYSYNHLDMGGIPTVIDWKRRRYICKDCGRTFSEISPFGPENFHQSYAVLREIALNLHRTNETFKSIGEKFHVSSSIVQLYADSFIRAPRMTLPENLGIDEISSNMSKYGGSYLCVFVDNKNRTLNEILPNRSKHTLSKHFESIPLEERNNVKYVTIDMWRPYKDVVTKYLKNAKIAVDPFHVIKHLSDGFSELRISIMKQCVYNSPSYYLLKKWHKLLESDKYDLDNKPRYNSVFKQKLNYGDLLNLTLSINPELKLAYELKEMYRDFNKNCTYEQAEERLNDLIAAFEEADLPCYKEFLGILKNWKQEIINSFLRPYDNRKQSNTLAENINEKLRQLIDIANGYSNFERFRARALYCLNDRLFYALTTSLTSKKRKGNKRGTYNKEHKLIEEDIEVLIEDNDPLED